MPSIEPTPRVVASLIFCLAATLAVGCASAPPVNLDPKTPAEKLAALGFLTGDWVGTRLSGKDKEGKGIWEAHYTSPESGMMLGTSKEHVEGKVKTFEFDRFEISEGKVLVWLYPNGAKKASLELTQLDVRQRRAIFENPKIKFPQQIDFWRIDDERLVISVTSSVNGDEKRRGGYKLVLRVMPR